MDASWSYLEPIPAHAKTMVEESCRASQIPLPGKGDEVLFVVRDNADPVEVCPEQEKEVWQDHLND